MHLETLTDGEFFGGANETASHLANLAISAEKHFVLRVVNSSLAKRENRAMLAA